MSDYTHDDSLFEDLDLENAADDPWKHPDNTYNCALTESSAGPTKDASKKGWSLEYTILVGDRAGMVIQEWKQLKPADEKTRSFVKQRLASFNIPPDQMNSVNHEKLLNDPALKNLAVTVKGGRVTAVKIMDENSTGLDVFARPNLDI